MHPLADGFADYLQAEVRSMENLNKLQHEQGGYFLTVRGTSKSEIYPALSSGIRPMDHNDEYL